MEKTLTPLQKLRRSFKQGRPAKEVPHTPLSAVQRACERADDLGKQITKLHLDAVKYQVAVVAVSSQERFAGRVFNIPPSAQGIGRVIDDLAALSGSMMVGLIFAVLDTKSGEYEYWTQPFNRGREAEKILEIAVTDQVKKLQGGGSN